MKKEIKIGILGILAITTIVLGLKFLKGQNIFNTAQKFYIDYSDVNGLTISSPVYIHGFQIGTVTEIGLKPSNLQVVQVTIEVDKEIQIPKTTVAEILDQGFMGNKMIKLVYPSIKTTDFAISGDYLHGRTKGLLSSMLGQPEELGVYMTQIEYGVTGILDTIQDYLKNVDKTKGIGLALSDLQLTIANLKNTTHQLNLLLAGSNASLQSAFANLNGITGNINNKSKEIAGILDNFNHITGQIKDGQLDQTIHTVNTTMQTANERMVEFKTTLQDANSAINDMSVMISGINTGKGTLGKLITDDDLYNNLERTSKQLDLLMQDLRLNPKRYVNVSVFGKKQKEYNLPEDDPANPLLHGQADSIRVD